MGSSIAYRPRISAAGLNTAAAQKSRWRREVRVPRLRGTRMDCRGTASTQYPSTFRAAHSCITPSGETDAWIHNNVQEVAEKNAEHHNNRVDINERHQRRKVLLFDRRPGQTTHARDPEQEFHKNTAAQHGRQEARKQRDNWNQSIAQGMYENHPWLGDPFGTRRAHEILLNHVEHARTRIHRHPRQTEERQTG